MTERQPHQPTMAEIEEMLERSYRERDEFVAKLRERLDNFDDEVARSNRGFTRMAPVPSDYGGDVAVYESSNAEHPHIWVKVECPADMNRPDGPMIEAHAHLAIEGAELLHKQLGYLIKSHYQLQGDDQS